MLSKSVHGCHGCGATTVHGCGAATVGLPDGQTPVCLTCEARNQKKCEKTGTMVECPIGAEVRTETAVYMQYLYIACLPYYYLYILTFLLDPEG